MATIIPVLDSEVNAGHPLKGGAMYWLFAAGAGSVILPHQGTVMISALWLLSLQGVIGAFDTLYYHEWRARLPGRGVEAGKELKIHAARDFIYAVIFGTLPWLAWQGLWVAALVIVLLSEIVLTLTDFIVEIAVRKPLGDVVAGERVTHAVMGIIYGSMIACLIPVLREWWSLPTALTAASPGVPEGLRWSLLIMAAGVLLSGVRDLVAALGLSPMAAGRGRSRETARRRSRDRAPQL